MYARYNYNEYALFFPLFPSFKKITYLVTILFEIQNLNLKKLYESKMAAKSKPNPAGFRFVHLDGQIRVRTKNANFGCQQSRRNVEFGGI